MYLLFEILNIMKYLNIIIIIVINLEVYRLISVELLFLYLIEILSDFKNAFISEIH